METIENHEFRRYGRQMIVPEMGFKGQLALKRSKVLVVGAGGLGCPAISYLAGCGIGTLGIIDPDTVETSNLHRQILHYQPGKYKAESAAAYVRNLNPNVVVHSMNISLTPSNAIDIVSKYDLVLDCTDSPNSRYLVNDACVLSNKPLISASALKTEGQLAVYHYGQEGPCYRCLFPIPPPPQLIGSCGENGILGPVVGIMGVFQAVEAIKVVLRAEIVPSLSLFSMFSFPQWKQVKIRQRKPDCEVCGSSPSITTLHDYDYALFCGVTPEKQVHCRRIEAKQLRSELNNSSSVILDVRPSVQFDMCSVPGSLNIPMNQVRRMNKPDFLPFEPDRKVTVICRYGNDSREAAAKLVEWGLDAQDVIGGLDKWSSIDPTFPRY